MLLARGCVNIILKSSDHFWYIKSQFLWLLLTHDMKVSIDNSVNFISGTTATQYDTASFGIGYNAKPENI